MLNKYVKRKVASNSSKPCFICYKPTDCVLTSGEDFFYVCEGHLSDAGFASLDSASVQAAEERARISTEIEALKEKWSTRKKEEKDKKDTDKDKKDTDGKDTKAAADEADAPVLPSLPPAHAPVYELHKNVLNLRAAAKRRVVQEKRTRDLLASPNMFPEVPKHAPK